MKKKILMNEWLNEQVLSVKKSSLKTYKSYERGYIGPLLGTCYLNEINKEKIRWFKKNLKKQLASKTEHNILSYLKRILKLAETKGYAVAPLNLKNIKVVTEEKGVFNQEEQKDLSATLKASNAPQDIGILIGLSTGMRLGEVLGLSVQDIDLAAGVIRVRKNAQRVY
ncbi:MAG: tyrosine-type recombinase/integrase, partial [Eubacterium sp.]